MATRVKRITDFAKHGMNYLHYRTEIKPLQTKRDSERDWLKKYIGDGKTDGMGIADDKGNLNVYFDSPVPGPGNTVYYGMQQRRVPGGEFMNTDEVKKWASANLKPDELTRVVYTKPVEVVDVEELYVLQQEGHITSKQLRSLIRHEDDSYQLWPIDEAPVEDDE
jgi:hypothetical protein